MATYFLSSAGSNTAPYDTEAKAATTLAVLTALPLTAGDIIKASSTHSESTNGPSWVFPTTSGTKLLSVLFDGSGTGALTAGASLANSTNVTATSLTSGFCYIYGCTIAGNSGASASNLVNIGNSTTVASNFVLENCTISAPGTSTSARIQLGAAGTTAVDSHIRLINCTFSNGAVKPINLRAGTIEIDGATLAGTAPTSVFSPVVNGYGSLEVSNADLSAVAWTNLVDVGTLTKTYGPIRFTGCKLVSSFVAATGTFAGPSCAPVELIDCHSGDTHYYYQKTDWFGTVTANNSIYYNASDGTSSISWQMVSSANVTYARPLMSPPMSYYNTSTSAMTTTVECTNDGTTFKDNELWQETSAKVTSGSPVSTVNRADRSDALAAGANQASSSVSWTGTGGFGAEVKQKLESGSFTPAEVGLITVRACLAKASSTVYVSPKILSTSGRQYMSKTGAYVNEGASGGAPRVALSDKGLILNLANGKYVIDL